MSNSFVDTNILIYAFSANEPEKAARANEILFSKNMLISLQVINEFSNTCLRKLNKTPNDIIAAVEEIISIIDVVCFSQSTQIKALQLVSQYCFSYYDSLIVATALESGCTTIYSEDMQHTQTIENQLKIINPFI